MKMSEVLDKYTNFLIQNSKTYYTEEYDDILGVENLEFDKENLIKEFLFREFNNIYPNEVNVGI